ncbi:MAG: NAD(P)/FAD-dependent oxidoreductase [Gemmatimonadaceae bacterium]
MTGSNEPVRHDAIIVGAGPAGLSAALMLGRCRRNVLVCDGGGQRNIRAKEMHGYLTRDGIAPSEFLRLAAAELEPYDTVKRLALNVTSARRVQGGFEVSFSDGQTRECRKLLLATGVVDEVPDLPGIAELYGTSVHHCPYCDGWEVRDQSIVVYGKGIHAFSLAMTLRTWTSQLLVCTGGPAEMEPDDRAMLSRHGISVREDMILRLEGSEHQIERVIFATGDPVECRALFFSTGQRQRSLLAQQLDCVFNEKGTVATGRCEATNVPGLFVAGDASQDPQFVIVAAAEGTEAATQINESLEKEDRILA